MMWENGRISSDGDPNAPPMFTHGRTYSNVSRSSGLRNEVKFSDGPDGIDENDTSKEAFMDAPLYAHGSPTKIASQQPQIYSHHHNASRSNLAPTNSNPAYQQHTPSRSRTDAQYAQQPAYGRYDDPAGADYADYEYNR